MHRWYLNDGVFMGSVVEVEGVLASLKQALPPPGRGAPHAEDDSMGPGTGVHGVPLANATRLHLEEGTQELGVPIQSDLYHSPVGVHLGTLKGKFARTCAALAALADTQCAHALMR